MCARRRRQFIERRSCTLDPLRTIAQLRQRLRHEGTDIPVVLDHQHTGAVPVFDRLLLCSGHSEGSYDTGQVQRESGALTDCALDKHLSTRLLNEPDTCDNPRPVPWPTPFVVKNGSKI